MSDDGYEDPPNCLSAFPMALARTLWVLVTHPREVWKEAKYLTTTP